MELLELLLSLPNMLEALVLLCRGLWWLIKAIGVLVVVAARGISAAGRAIGRGLDRLRDRVRARDFPIATVVVDRRADRRAI